MAIKKLEEELQIKLFERNANEITVTPQFTRYEAIAALRKVIGVRVQIRR